MADTASKEMSVFIPLQGIPIENEQSLSCISDPVRTTATPSISRVSAEYRDEIDWRIDVMAGTTGIGIANIRNSTGNSSDLIISFPYRYSIKPQSTNRKEIADKNGKIVIAPMM